MLFLQQFNFQFEYKPGKCLDNVDTLSRITSIIPESSATFESISEAQLKDDQLAPIVKALSDGTSFPSKVAPGLRQAFLRNGVLYRQFRQSSMSPMTAQLVVPNTMKDVVLNQLHDQAGHLGVHKTTEKVKERFYWPGYEQDIENWVHACQPCQKRNPPQPVPKAPMGTIRTHHPFQKISWDIMGPLPVSSKGHKYIFVVGDLVWLYVPAIKSGRTKKFSCLWRGPYTVIDKTSVVNYKVQLLGSTKTVVVHRNRLKTCFGRPQWKSTTGTNKKALTNEQTSAPIPSSTEVGTSKRSYAEVTAGAPSASLPGGYTSTDDIRTNSRPQRNRRPPDRYRP